MRWCALGIVAVLAVGCSDEGLRAYRVYRVQAGDTLGGIAERFGVGAGQIVRLNDLDNPNLIRAGSGLKLPDRDSTAALPRYRPREPFEGEVRACALRLLSDQTAHERVERAGCWTTHCLAVGDDRRVCKCATDDGGRVFLERAGGDVLLGWPGAGFMGDTPRFEVLVGDLDRDGADELIVASHRVTSNGMAVATWNVAILDGGRTDRPPLTYSVEGHAPAGFGVDPGSGACDVRATEWLDADDQLHGVGHYFVTRPLAFSGGALTPRAEEPVVGERMRDGTVPVVLESEPFAGEDAAWSRGGTVARARRRPGDYHAFALDLDIELADGARAAFRPSDRHSLDDPHTYARLGDAATGRVYPAAYVPSDPAALEGRRVSIDGFADPGTDLRWHIIWLE